MIRITIVAAAIAVRAGLRALFSDDPQLEVVSEASSLGELADDQAGVDVIVWSPGPAADKAALQAELGRVELDGTKALLMVHDDPKGLDVLTQLPLRGWGLLDTTASQAELIAGVQAVYEGLSLASSAWLSQALFHPVSGEKNEQLIEPLTPREIEILQLLALGLTNKQIAARLKISAHTVKFHVSTIFTKLGTTNRVETVNLGLKNGLIVL